MIRSVPYKLRALPTRHGPSNPTPVNFSTLLPVTIQTPAASGIAPIVWQPGKIILTSIGSPAQQAGPVPQPPVSSQPGALPGTQNLCDVAGYAVPCGSTPSPAPPVSNPPATVSTTSSATALSASPPSSAAAATTGFNYTADLEVVENEMLLYGDTWDDAQGIVASLYAAGVTPGTVTPAQALSQMTAIASAASTTASTFSLSEIPWYGWALGGVGVLLLFRKK